MNIVFGILFVLILPVAVAAVIGAPPVWTPLRAVRAMIKNTGMKPGDVAYDLGAGIGRFIVLGKKEFGLDIKGVEYAFVLCWIGKLNLLLQSISPKRLIRRNFYTMDFGNADIFFCFLMPRALARLKGKFEREAKLGARIVCYAFEIPGWKPSCVVKEKGIASIRVYEIGGI
ncbi:MAG: hypothetical protein AAB631_00005 [Patescibacteria group bacterium]